MKVDVISRVLAAPVHATFPFPRQPEFSYTDFPNKFGVQSSSDGKDFEFDQIAECIHPKTMFIPHNMWVTNYTWSLGSVARSDNLRLDWFISTLVSNIDTSYIHETSSRLFYFPELPRDGSANIISATNARYLHYAMDWSSWYADNSGPLWTELPFAPMFNIVAQTNLEPHSAVTGCQGFTGWLQRSHLNRVQLYSVDGNHTLLDTIEPLHDTGYMALRWKIGRDANARYFELRFYANDDPVVRMSTDSNFLNVTELAQLKQTNEVVMREGIYAGPHSAVTYDDYSTVVEVEAGYRGERFEVRLIGGYLYIKIESGDTPFVWRHMVYEAELNEDGDQVPIGRIHNIRVVGVDCLTFAWWINPIKFKVHAQWDSNPINVGFIPITDPTITVKDAFYRPLPHADYTVATTYDISGQMVKYSLVFDNASDGDWQGKLFANLTRAVRATTVKFEEVLHEPFGRWVQLYPEEIRIDSRLSWSDRSIVTDGSLTFNNFGDISDAHAGGPNYPWGQWANYSGTIAVTVDVMRTLLNDDGSVYETTGWEKIFTGYGNLQNQSNIDTANNSRFIMNLIDRRISMMTSKFFLPWMDGWNEYYYAAYMANICGVKRGSVGDSDLDFIDKVPADPDDDSPGGGAYFLPLGVGGSPLMKLSPGSFPWQHLGRTAQINGFIRFFDYQGKFHWQKFVPTPTVAKRYFFAHHNFDALPYNANHAVLSGGISRDLSQVRSAVTFIGIDAHGLQWSPLVSHRQDNGSIYDNRVDIWEQGQMNQIGFQNAFVDVDSQFANLEFADQACERAFEVFRLPSISGSLNTWLQTDMFVGDWIGVVDVRSGAYDAIAGAFAPMLVVSTGHVIRPGYFRTNMGLQFFPEVTGLNQGTGSPTLPESSSDNTQLDLSSSGPTL